MKKFIGLLLTVLLIFCFVGCNNTEDNTPVEKTAKEKLCEYIKTNGANYQGVYKLIEFKNTSTTSISCTAEENIVFIYYFEGTNNEGYVELDYYEGSVTQSVIYEYKQQGYSCIVNGTLFSEHVSYDNCILYNITYRENFPSSISESTIEKIVATSHKATKAMLSSVNEMLVEYVGIELKSLGFKSW
ncbi:MAG: hypothetical protein ACI4MS_01045 [Candidatus Coproplasma sp.]